MRVQSAVLFVAAIRTEAVSSNMRCALATNLYRGLTARMAEEKTPGYYESQKAK